MRRTRRPTTARAGDEGMASTSMTATFTTIAPEPTRTRIGQTWATCPCHAQDGCQTCRGAGVIVTPRIHTDDIDLTTHLTERTTW